MVFFLVKKVWKQLNLFLLLLSRGSRWDSELNELGVPLALGFSKMKICLNKEKKRGWRRTLR